MFNFLKDIWSLKISPWLWTYLAYGPCQFLGSGSPVLCVSTDVIKIQWVILLSSVQQKGRPTTAVPIYLIPKVKVTMKGQYFESAQNIKAAMAEQLKTLTEEELPRVARAIWQASKEEGRTLRGTYVNASLIFWKFSIVSILSIVSIICCANKASLLPLSHSPNLK